ncbi:trypsin-like serine peptidase [Yinghuangia soli]|uniref:V8-like Glu-specific endopeptidase n=1 Tax=Yinghuangia soli TaxID=2908204 RepID=A0AA41Q8W0_9ACTN|nr:hypothetical protein [Yinghuangia soli]MCF2533060.1 hypothetical protein [Yinghuangia soli]
MTRSVRTLLVAVVVAVALLVAGTVMALSLGSDEPLRPPAAATGSSPAPDAPDDTSPWTPERMSQARPRDPLVAEAPDPSGSAGSPGPNPSGTLGPLPDNVAEARPPVVAAAEVPRPYARDAVVGKLFFDAPEGPAVCSGTVIADPTAPGRSNLVWTAGHCVHAGKGGTWFKNVQFVPAFNSGGHATLGNLREPGPVAPFGQWWAADMATSQRWKDGGTGGDSPASAYDYGVVRVRNPDNSGRSLQETVGWALPVWFDAPRDLARVAAFGYPQDPPYNGLAMFHCDQDPRRLTVDPASPPLLRIGCTMTGGASGGGWYAKAPDGEVRLVSNSALGGTGRTWLAGPYLGADARTVLASVRR